MTEEAATEGVGVVVVVVVEQRGTARGSEEGAAGG